MPTVPSRSLPRRLAPPPNGRAIRPPVESTRLRVLVAGVEEGDRPPIDAAVRKAFASRDPGEPWSVSLVRLRTVWSITLSGPGERFRSLSFTAEEHQLAEAISEAISDEQPTAAEAPSDWPAAQVIQDRVACDHCRKEILVSYEAQPDEPKTLAPLACPHCWMISRVQVASGAAVGGDYRADKG